MIYFCSFVHWTSKMSQDTVRSSTTVGSASGARSFCSLEGKIRHSTAITFVIWIKISLFCLNRDMLHLFGTCVCWGLMYMMNIQLIEFCLLCGEHRSSYRETILGTLSLFYDIKTANDVTHLDNIRTTSIGDPLAFSHLCFR